MRRSMLSVHARLIDALVESGRLDRALEFLPSHAQINARLAAGEGLAGPELCVLLAYVKAGLSAAMLAGDLPDDPAYAATAARVLPAGDAGRLAGRAEAITEHPLAREIVTTETVNEMVNRAGHHLRLPARGGDGGAPARTRSAPTRSPPRCSTCRSCGGRWPRWTTGCRRDARTRCTCRSRRLLDRAARWLLTRRPQPLDVRRRDRPLRRSRSRDLTPQMPRLVCGTDTATRAGEIAELIGHGRAGGDGQPRGLLAAHVQPAGRRRRGRRHAAGDLLECAELLLRAVRAPGLRPAADRR